jgi:hypothetical protein
MRWLVILIGTFVTLMALADLHGEFVPPTDWINAGGERALTGRVEAGPS